MPPTTVPALYSGKPPASADRPSGEGFGPIVSVPVAPSAASVGAGGWIRSEQTSCENCTPNSGPEGAFDSPGLNDCWTIWLAVRVENALPSDERYAPVTAFEIAASSEGINPRGGGPGTKFSTPPTPSRPPVTPRCDEIWTAVRAPFMRNRPSTLPTRSTTAIVAGVFCACASATACAMIRPTSAWVRNEDAVTQEPSQPRSEVGFGAGGGAVPTSLPELPLPLQAARPMADTSATARSVRPRMLPPQRPIAANPAAKSCDRPWI